MSKNILVIDDDANLRQSLEDILSVNGFTSIAVDSGKKALKMIRENHYPIALIDLKLSDMPGLEVLESIKQISPATECIIMTGFASAESAMQAVQFGAYGYVQKPYDVDQLLLTIRRALERSETGQALSVAEARYRQLYESASDGIVTVDMDGTILDFNKAYQEICGYSADELRGMKFWQITPIKWASLEKRILKNQVLKRGYSDLYEKEYIHKDGHIFPVEVNAFLNTNQLGHPESMWAFVRDISERKRNEENLRRQLQEVSILHRIALAGTQAKNIDEIIEQTTLILGENIFSDYFGVNIYDENRHWLMPHPSYQGMDETLKNLGTSADEGITGRALRTGEPQIVDDVSLDADYVSFRASTCSEIAVPIKISSKIFGVMNAESEKENCFTTQDLNLMVSISNQMALAIQKLQLEEEQRQYTRQISNLYETALAISSMLDTESLYKKLYQQINALIDLDVFLLVLSHPGEDRMELVYLVEDGRPLYQKIGTRKSFQDGGLTGWVIENRQSFLTNNAKNNQLPAMLVVDGKPIQSWMGTPLIVKGDAIGAISVQSYSIGAFTEEQLRMLEMLASQAAIAIDNARLLENSRRQIDRLSALHDIDMVINSSLDLRVTLNILLDQVIDKLSVDAAAVMLLNPGTQMLEFAAGRGFRTRTIEQYRLRMDESLSEQTAMERHLMQALNLDDMDTDQAYINLMQVEKFEGYFSVPLVAKGQIKGVLDIFNRSPLNPDHEWFNFLETLGGQAAIAIDNTTLLEDLQRSNVELTLAYDTTLEGWSRALDLRDEETEGHTRRVTDLTVRIAFQLDVPEQEIIHIRRGTLLHDIGKMGIPDAILRKPGPLTDEEWVIMRNHPVIAAELLNPITFLQPAMDIPYCHHEKYDGSGYPRGLKGNQIPLAARIFALVDVWDALTSDRPYRKAWSEKKAMDYIKEQSGSHFDPQITDTFLRIIKNELINRTDT